MEALTGVGAKVGVVSPLSQVELFRIYKKGSYKDGAIRVAKVMNIIPGS